MGLQEIHEEQAGVNYSYYQILIVETVQPVVNSPMLLREAGILQTAPHCLGGSRF